MKAHKPSERALKAVTHFKRELSGSLTVSVEAFVATLLDSLRFFAADDEYAVFSRTDGEGLNLVGGSPAARLISRTGGGLSDWGDRLAADKMLHENGNSGNLVDRRWRSWILLPLPARKQPLMAVLLARKSGRFAEGELEAARYLREYLSASLRDVRSRNRKAARLAQEERHRALLLTQTSIERDAGDIGDFGRGRDWSAGTGSDASLVHRITSYNVCYTKLLRESKGELNNAIASGLFELLASQGVKSHYIAKLSDREMLCRKVSIVPLEVIVRNVAAGSFSKRLGVAEGSELKTTVFEISVITSYSIHYTKLYEQPGRAGLPFFCPSIGKTNSTPTDSADVDTACVKRVAWRIV